MQTEIFIRSLLTIFALAQLVCAADAQSKLMPSEEYPGPWLEITGQVRQALALNGISACSQAAGRQSSRNAGEYLVYCTKDERNWTSWVVQPAAPTIRRLGRLMEGIPLPDPY